MTYQTGPRIVTDGLVFCVDAADTNSYPGSGTTWTDLSGNGNNGTLTNGPTFSSSNRGSIVFDGTNDYILFSDSYAPITTLTFTISTILSVDSETANWRRIVSKGHYGMTPGYILQRYGVTTGIRFSFGIGGTGGEATAVFVYTSDAYTINRFYALDFISDGSKCFLYINGNKANITKYGTTFGTIENNTDLNYSAGVANLSIATNDKFTVGAYRNSTSTILEYFLGKIPNIRIYNRALSASEVLQNYNATKGRYGF